MLIALAFALLATPLATAEHLFLATSYGTVVCLDTATGKEIMAVFDRLHREGNTIIMVTHEAHIAEFAERVIHILDGKIEREERRTKTGIQ